MKTQQEQPISRREGIKMLNEMSLIEYALEAAVCGDQGGPMTSSPSQQRNVANTLRGLASQFETLADVVDPLMEGKPPFRVGFQVGDEVQIKGASMRLRIVAIQDRLATLESLKPPVTRYHSATQNLIALETKEPADGEDTTSTPPAGA